MQDAKLHRIDAAKKSTAAASLNPSGFTAKNSLKSFEGRLDESATRELPQKSMEEKVAEWRNGSGRMTGKGGDFVIGLLLRGNSLDLPLSPSFIKTNWTGLRKKMDICFGSYNESMRAAGLDPYAYRETIRQIGNDEDIQSALKKYGNDGRIVSKKMIKRKSPELYRSMENKKIALDNACEDAGVKKAKEWFAYTPELAIARLKEMASDPEQEENLRPDNMIRNCGSLYRKGLSMLGGYETALLAAGLDPEKYLAGMSPKSRKTLRFVPENVPKEILEKYPRFKERQAHERKPMEKKKTKESAAPGQEKIVAIVLAPKFIDVLAIAQKSIGGTGPEPKNAGAQAIKKIDAPAPNKDKHTRAAENIEKLGILMPLVEDIGAAVMTSKKADYSDWEEFRNALVAMIDFGNDRIRLPTLAQLRHFAPDIYAAMNTHHIGYMTVIQRLKDEGILPKNFDTLYKTYVYPHARKQKEKPDVKQEDLPQYEKKEASRKEKERTSEKKTRETKPFEKRIETSSPKRFGAEGGTRSMGWENARESILNLIRARDMNEPREERHGRMLTQAEIDALKETDPKLYEYIWDNGHRAKIAQRLQNEGYLKTNEQARTEAEGAVLQAMLSMGELGLEEYKRSKGLHLKPLNQIKKY